MNSSLSELPISEGCARLSRKVTRLLKKEKKQTNDGESEELH